MTNQRFIVKNVKLPVELNDRLEIFREIYSEKLLGELGYSASYADVIRYLIKIALDKLESEYGIK